MSTHRTSASERVYTNRLFVDRMNKGDKKFFLNLSSDVDVRKYFAFGQTKADILDYFENDILKCEDPKSLFLVIRTKNTFEAIGILNFFYYSNGAWYVEYALLEPFRRKGYLTELLLNVVQNCKDYIDTFCNEKVEVNELMFDISPDNTPSIHLINKIARVSGKELSILKSVRTTMYSIYL